MEAKKIRTSDDDKIIEELEKLIEQIKAGKVAHCEVRVAIIDDKKAKKKVVEEEEEEEKDECECEECKCDTPEDIFHDLGKTIGCMAYYELPLSLALVTKYNKAFLDILTKDDDDEDS